MVILKKGTSLRVSSDNLRALAETIFQKRGVPKKDAVLVADILIEANLRGHDSHGVIRIPNWIKGLDCGALKPACQPSVVRDKGATALLHGDSGLGPVVAKKATDLVLQKAKNFGVGLVSVRKASHIGIFKAFTPGM